jgi:hypothetical protein
VVAIIVNGEAAYRRSLREEIERIEAALKAQEELRRKRLAEANAARLAALHHSGELLRQARDIRELIASVKQAVLEGEQALWPDEMADWELWANSVADGIDPVRSGQVREHLRPPEAG